MGKWQISKEKALERAVHVLKTGYIFPEENDVMFAAQLEDLRRTIVRAKDKAKRRYQDEKINPQ